MSKKEDMMWVEKYRPRNIKHIVQHEDIKRLLSNRDTVNNFPHLLLCGPPGTGKTTTALGICRHIFIKPNICQITKLEIIKERILELNASDERGIKVIREKIKTFASLALNNYKNIPKFKIIILDEADAMTNDAQFALRRIIEQYSHITRFILICNYVTKIIPPLSSRCSKYTFSNINIESTKKIILKILTNEEIVYDNLILEQMINIIHHYSNGDLRKSIQLLQRAVYISKLKKEQLSLKIFEEIINKIPFEIINNFYQILKSPMDDFAFLSDNLTSFLNDKYSLTDFIDELTKCILNDQTINDHHKSQIFIKTAEICNLLLTSSSDYIQMLSLCAYINSIICQI